MVASLLVPQAGKFIPVFSTTLNSLMDGRRKERVGDLHTGSVQLSMNLLLTCIGDVLVLVTNSWNFLLHLNIFCFEIVFSKPVSLLRAWLGIISIDILAYMVNKGSFIVFSFYKSTGKANVCIFGKHLVIILWLSIFPSPLQIV